MERAVFENRLEKRNDRAAARNRLATRAPMYDGARRASGAFTAAIHVEYRTKVKKEMSVRTIKREEKRGGRIRRGTIEERR